MKLPERRWIYQCHHFDSTRWDYLESLWNHYSNFTDAAITSMNNIPGRVGDIIPRAPQDMHECWRRWVTDNWFDEEVGGWPRVGQPGMLASLSGCTTG